MDFDLWGPCYDQALQVDSYVLPNEWGHGYYFDNRSDLMEQEALNKKYCMQVLRTLNSKADSEVDEVEKDQGSLQCELALCCDTLEEKIDSLDLAIKNLQSNSENSVDVSDQTSKEPPQELHKLLRALVESLLQQKEKQISVAAEDANSDALGQVAGVQEESTHSSGFHPDITIKEESKDPSFLTADDSSAVKSLESQKDKATCQVTDKSVDIATSSISSDTLKHAHHRNEGEVKSEPYSESLSEEPGDNFISSGTEMKALGKSSDLEENFKDTASFKKGDIDSKVTTALKSVSSANRENTTLLHVNEVRESCLSCPEEPAFNPEKLLEDQMKDTGGGVDPKVTAKTGKIVSSANRENTSLLHVNGVNETCLSCAEDPALKPVLRLQNQMKDTKKTQAKKSVKQSVGVSQNASSDEQSDLKSSLYLARQNKRKTQANVSRPGSFSADADIGPHFISEANKKLKYEPGNENISSSRFLDGKIPIKSESSGTSMPEMYARASSMNETLAFLFLKGKKKSTGEPVSSETKSSAVRMGIPNVHEKMPNAATRGNSMFPSSSSVNPDNARIVCSEPSGQLTSINNQLTKLRLIDLKSIAKQNELKNYSKLTKKDLVELLTNELGSGKLTGELYR